MKGVLLFGCGVAVGAVAGAYGAWYLLLTEGKVKG